MVNDIAVNENAPSTFLLEKHSDYLAAYGSKKNDFEYCMTEYLRLSGVYWGLTAMDVLGQLDR